MELNGRPVALEAVRALALTNIGHFTSMRVEGRRVRGLSLHLERLARDCRTVFGTDLDLDQCRTYLRRAVTAQEGTFTVRVTVFDPNLGMQDPAAAATPQILITSRSSGELSLPPLRVSAVPFVRDLPHVKHVGLFGALHARRTAQLAGFDDALFYGPDNIVSEGGTWNVGFIDAEGAVVWPKADVLPGTTMALLQQHHDHQVQPVTLASVPTMQAAFATNVSIGVRAISAVDGTALPSEHPTLARLRETYLNVPGDEI
ncbi:hypothetical protein GCM10010329_63120 [Streptomyces spiroverticillatus]|nr:hypothetical protein GCM10010329_63120 [Streptomyces spiroverticillatus]